MVARVAAAARCVGVFNLHIRIAPNTEMHGSRFSFFYFLRKKAQGQSGSGASVAIRNPGIRRYLQ
jgi:hypothetical protein